MSNEAADQNVETEVADAPAQAIDLSNDSAAEANKAVVIIDPETGKDNTYLTDDDGDNYLEFEGLRVYVTTFGGALKGVLYHYKQFTSLDKAIEVHGADKVLAALNDNLNAGTRNKVKSSKIPKFDDSKAQESAIRTMLTEHPVQFTINEAIRYEPGERDQTSGQILAVLKAAQKDGVGTTKIAAIMQRLMAVMAKENLRRGIDDGQVHVADDDEQ